jgi:putative ABC transport system ATP-binding protein
MTVILEGVALRKRFGLTEALRGADLAVRAGEVVAVMGPSGSGKSTLLHCLAGILRPDDGSVVFDGRRVDTLSDRQRTFLRRGAFGFVFQFGQLVPELTAVENVAAPLLLAGQRRRPAIAAAQAWFERLALTGLQGRLPGELSGGQAQRVAVARALIGRPRLVFADEPTGALDTAAGDDVMELLVASVREQDAAAVVVTHEPRVAAFADRTVLVQDGLVDADADAKAGVVG